MIYFLCQNTKQFVCISLHKTMRKSSLCPIIFFLRAQLKFFKRSPNSLDYIAVHPNSYKQDKSYPLIILLHGYGSNMKDLAPLGNLISKEGYVIVFPNAPNQLMSEFGPEAFSWSNFNTLGNTETLEFIQDMKNTESMLNNFLK